MSIAETRWWGCVVLLLFDNIYYICQRIFSTAGWNPAFGDDYFGHCDKDAVCSIPKGIIPADNSMHVFYYFSFQLCSSRWLKTKEIFFHHLCLEFLPSHVQLAGFSAGFYKLFTTSFAHISFYSPAFLELPHFQADEDYSSWLTSPALSLVLINYSFSSNLEGFSV